MLVIMKVSVHNGLMSFPVVEPFTYFSSEEFLGAVLQMRDGAPQLAAPAVAGDDEFFVNWVRTRWPETLQWVGTNGMPRCGPANKRTQPEAVDYAGVVHGRELRGENDIRRVAAIARACCHLRTSTCLPELKSPSLPGWSGLRQRAGCSVRHRHTGCYSSSPAIGEYSRSTFLA